MRYKITIEYDGTDTLGWQRQLDGPSIQEYLENALTNLSPDKQLIPIQGAGRTDCGVHAIAQVAHFDLERNIEDWKLRDALNYHLRELNAPVAILEVEQVSHEFNARFSAKGRSYIYRILNRRSPTILKKNRVWWVPVELDIEAMQQASTFLLGHHDFSSFRAAACQAKSPIKTLDKLDIYRQKDEIIFEVEAKSFLHHQVRNIVGTLKLVGEGSITPLKVKEILEAKDRKAAGPTAPACGLYLSRVWY
ncbi:MAG: tRNA pseudouridine(38-40) synthase TruA [Alphaproteobacteria bacterium]|nr:tRNA pseudouridine(38-40) synthase TruA [Alphaproteobacteria bacterium]